ncbi:MAG: phenylalanine--tRNA ligase subunit alpha [Firmicutes bacterium]|nr:phenylalanine--tRNA ligase subunit alpha [Bacillota bacterium]
MQDKINELQESIQQKVSKIANLTDLETMRVQLLGKKGEITQLLKSLGTLSKEERPAAGQLVNKLRVFAETQISTIEQKLSKEKLAQDLQQENIDVTMPGRRRLIGHLHPLTLVLNEMQDLFIGMGFTIADGPEIETDYYNFEALNIPANHPVKDEQDTFYTDEGFVLRTQTSGVQIRVMEQNPVPPIRIIAPGTVYRSDDWDATHAPNFHQIEGLVVDQNVTMADLKGILILFAKKILGENIKTRFRPSFFPFTEPSAEMDINCFVCQDTVNENCPVCKGSGWVELLGCGMVHPKVLQGCNIDPQKYSGYAFGMGIDRIVMQRYNITDIRLLYENDMQFLTQF